DPRSLFRISQRLVDCPAEIGVISAQASQASPLLRSGEVRAGFLGQRDEVGAVRLARGRGRTFAGVQEPLGGELPDGLEQAVTELLSAWLSAHETLVNERSQQVEDVERLDVALRAHGLRGLEIE